MKTTFSHFRNASFSLLVILVALTSSCTYANRQNGSGNVTKEERNVGPFNKLDLGLVYDAVIIPSAEEKVIVETDDNLQQYVIVEKMDSTLSVKIKKHVNIGKHTAGKVYIYTKGIKTLNNSSVGKLYNEGTLIAEIFTLNNNAVGKTDLTIKANEIDIQNSAVGKTDLYLQGDILSLNNSSVGKTELKGICRESHINNSSVGSFDSRNLITQILHITNSSVGKTDISAEREFYIENSAVGKLDIYGRGVIKKLNDHGIEKTSKH